MVLFAGSVVPPKSVVAVPPLIAIVSSPAASSPITTRSGASSPVSVSVVPLTAGVVAALTVEGPASAAAASRAMAADVVRVRCGVGVIAPQDAG